MTYEEYIEACDRLLDTFTGEQLANAMKSLRSEYTTFTEKRSVEDRISDYGRKRP